MLLLPDQDDPGTGLSCRGGLMTTRQKMGVVGVIFAVMVVATVIFAATFLLTSAIFHFIGQPSSAFLTHIINTILGLFFCFTVLTVVGHYFGSKQRAIQTGVFGPVFEAMRKIA